MTDHSLISFSLSVQKPPIPTGSLSSPNSLPTPTNRLLKFKKLDTYQFSDALEDLLTVHSKALSCGCYSPETLNDKVNLLSSILIKASHSDTDTYVSANANSKKCISPWWKSELGLLRKKTK